MILVTIEVTDSDGRLTTIDWVEVINRGPVAPDEAGDPGGERRYEVIGQGGRRCMVTHFRRDGYMPLVLAALRRLWR